jgi:small subunit ribosomal protein S20
MAHSKQALKRVRQSEKARIQRKSQRSEIKSIAKQLSELVAKKDADSAKALLRKALSKLDKAAKVHVYHRNAAARRKSKLARLVNSVAAPAAPAAPAAQS